DPGMMSHSANILALSPSPEVVELQRRALGYGRSLPPRWRWCVAGPTPFKGPHAKPLFQCTETPPSAGLVDRDPSGAPAIEPAWPGRQLSGDPRVRSFQQAYPGYFTEIRMSAPQPAHKARKENRMNNCNASEIQIMRRILPIACATALAVACTASLA